MKQILFIVFSCLALLSQLGCEKSAVSEFTDTPILEAYLEPGDYLTVKVSRQIPFSEGVQFSTDDINNLMLTVSFIGGTHILTPLGNGLYIDSTIVVSEGENYSVSFEFNSKLVVAFTGASVNKCIDLSNFLCFFSRTLCYERPCYGG